jgi:hypothetical protein
LKPPSTAVIADVHIVDNIDPILVDVMHHGYVDVVDRAIVEEMSGPPVAALVACAYVSETVINATIEADVRTPVAMEEAVSSANVAPIAGSPERTLVGRLRPHARYPVVAGRGVIPVAGGPEIIVTGSWRLLILRERRRRLRGCGHRRLAVAGVILGRGGEIGKVGACIHG